jgi:hypothetical protein
MIEALVERYREALRYWKSEAAEATRLLSSTDDRYTFCYRYVTWSYSDRSTQWSAFEHIEAYEAARGGAGGEQVDVLPVRSDVPDRTTHAGP